jgi:branched-chain amino acid transport system substrate-binding protein
MTKRLIRIVLVAVFALTSIVLVQAQTIKIGFIFPLTGMAAVDGDRAKRACQFAADELNAAGGINGRKVEFIFEDDAGTPKGGVSAAQKLIDIDRVNAIMGSLFSSIVLAVKPIATEKKVVVFAPLASHPGVFGDRNWVFSLDASPDDSSYVISKYWTEVKKAKTLAMLYTMTDNALAQSKFMDKWWKSFGGTVVANESFAAGGNDFRMQLTKIRAAKPDYIWFNANYQDAILIVRQMAELNITTQLCISPELEEPKLIEAVGKLLEGRLVSVGPAENLSATSQAVKAAFDRKWKERFGEEAEVVPRFTYDACQVLFTAMKKGGISGDALRNAIVGMTMEGVTGTIKMADDGGSGRTNGIRVFQGGKFVPLEWTGARR